MVQTLQVWRVEQESYPAEAPFPLWKPKWFPVVIANGNMLLYIDTAAVNEAGEAPVGYKEPFDDGTIDSVQAASFTQVVALWLDLIESGTFWLSDGFWDGDWDAVPTELKQSRLF